MRMALALFRELVGRVSGLGEDNDFVKAAVLTEAEERGELIRERAQTVANNARLSAAGYRRVPTTGRAGESRELGPNPDVVFLSRAFAKRLEPWARELREEGFGGPDVPFPQDLATAAKWIQTQSQVDREQWQRQDAFRVDVAQKIKRLADLAGLVVHPKTRFVKYVLPDSGHQQLAGAFPGTFLDRLARETDRVSEKSGFRPEVLTGFALTGLRPLISRVRITKKSGGCSVPGDSIPYRSVTLEFNAADVSYAEVRSLYSEVRKFFGVTDKERLSWHEFDFLELVNSMGGPPEQAKSRFWEEVLRRWKEEPAYESSPLNSWRAARNKYERLYRKRNLRDIIKPNPPLTLAELDRAVETGNNLRSLNR